MLRQSSAKAAAALLFGLSLLPFCGPLAQTAAAAADGLTVTTSGRGVLGNR